MDEIKQGFQASAEDERQKRINDYAAQVFSAPNEIPGMSAVAETTRVDTSPSQGGGSGKALARGFGSAFGVPVGTAIQLAGQSVTNPSLAVMGERVAKGWEEYAAANPRNAAETWHGMGSLGSLPWWEATAGEMLPQFAAMFVPGAAGARSINIGGRAVEWAGPLAEKLSRLGSVIAAGLPAGTVGGIIQGTGTYQQLKARGASEMQAVEGATKMGLAAIGAMGATYGTAFLPGTALSQIGGAAAVGGVANWLQGTANAVTLGADLKEAMQHSVESLVVGTVLGAGTAGTARFTEGGGTATLESPKPTDQAKPGTVAGGPDLAQKPEAPAQRAFMTPEEWQKSYPRADRWNSPEMTVPFLSQRLANTDPIPDGVSVQPASFGGAPDSRAVNVVFGKDGKPIGIVNVMLDANGRAENIQTAVSPDVQRTGIATALYDRATQEVPGFREAIGKGGFTPEGAKFAYAYLKGQVGEPQAGAMGAAALSGRSPSDVAIATDVLKNPGEYLFHGSIETDDAANIDRVGLMGGDVTPSLREAAGYATVPDGYISVFRKGDVQLDSEGSVVGNPRPIATFHPSELGINDIPISHRAQELGYEPNDPPWAMGAAEAASPLQAKAEPVAPPSSDIPLTINLDRVDGTANLKRALAIGNRLAAERMASDRATKSFETMRSEGAARLPKIEDAIAWDPTTQDPPGTERRAADFRDLAMNQVIESAKNPDDPQAQADFDTWMATFETIHDKVEYAESSMGRKLGLQRDPSDLRNVPMSEADVAALADKMRQTTDAPASVRMRLFNEYLKTKQQRTTTALSFAKAVRAWHDAFYASWMGGLVSSPRSQAVSNPFSNLYMNVRQIRDTAVAEMMGGGYSRSGIAPGETARLIAGMVDSQAEAWRVFYKIMRTGENPTAESKFEQTTVRITPEGLGVDPESALGHGVKLWGQMVSLETRGLIAPDVAAKVVTRNMTRMQLSLREATHEAAIYEKAGMPMTPDQFEAARARAYDDPSIMSASDDQALFNSFQNKPGALGDALYAFQRVPGMKWVVPFVKVMLNIPARGVEDIAGLNVMLSPRLRADIQAGGARRSTALAQIGLSVPTTLAIGALAHKGVLTGFGPSEYNRKKYMTENTNWKPYSVTFDGGKTYYSYAWMGPLAVTVGIISDMVQFGEEVPSWHLEEAGASVINSIAQNIFDRPWAIGIANLLGAAMGQDDKGVALFQNAAGSVVPAWVRGLASPANEPLTVRRTMLDRVISGIPGMGSKTPQLNLFGEPVIRLPSLGPDWLSPIFKSTGKPDAVDEEVGRLVKMGMTVDMPPWTLYGKVDKGAQFGTPDPKQGIELTPEQHNDWIRFAAGKQSGQTLKEALAEKFNDPSYKAMTDGPYQMKALWVRTLIGVRRNVAQTMLEDKYPELKSSRESSLVARPNALRGQGANNVRISP